jgi:RND family efflux transporter MFP subunit
MGRRASTRAVGLACLSLAAAACVAKNIPEPVLPKYKAKTIVAKTEKYKEEISSFGSIAFKTKTDISATVEGGIVELPVAEGSAVKAGALLAKLENVQLEMRKRQAESAVASARSALELAEAKLWEGRLQVEARIASIAKAQLQIRQKEYEVAELESSYSKKKSLLDIGGSTEEEVNSLLISLNAQRSALAAQKIDADIQHIGLRDEDLAARGMLEPKSDKERKEAIARLGTQTLKAEADAAKSQLEGALMDLASAIALTGELTLRAPDFGIVGALYAEKGEHVQQNAKVMTLMETDVVYAVFPVQESEALYIKEGMAVEASVDALKGENIAAKISMISPVIDAQTGAVTVKALIRNPAMRLRPGMFARLRIDLGAPRDVIKIPASSIAQKKGTIAKVFAVVNGKAFVKQVELGKELDGAFIVEKGLRPSEILIDAPSPLLKEGEDVEIEG